MPSPDSVPRRIIAYLETALPPDIAAPLTFDALAKRDDAYPSCIINASPSIPDQRAGGAVDTNTRALKIYLTLIWDAHTPGRTYDDFEQTADALADAMAAMQGTAALGNNVLYCESNPDLANAIYDSESIKYFAEIEYNVGYTRQP